MYHRYQKMYFPDCNYGFSHNLILITSFFMFHSFVVCGNTNFGVDMQV